MEQSLYVFMFLITLGALFLAQYKIRNPVDKFLMFVISGILFLALMIQSFNIETIYFDATTADYITYRLAEHGYEYLLPLGVCFIAAAFSLLNCIILIPSIWNRNFQNKDLKGF